MSKSSYLCRACMVTTRMNNLLTRLFAGSARTVVVKKNIVGSLVVRGVSIVVSFLLVPLTLGYVSAEMYGIWLILSSIILWLHFFDVGFTLGLKNRLAQALAMGDSVRARALVATTYAMMILIMVPLCVVLEIVVPYIPWAQLLNVSSEYNAEIIRALYVLIVCFGIYMVLNVITAVAAAYQRVALSAAFIVMSNALSLGVIALLTHTVQPSLVVLALALAGMPLVVLAAASVILYKSLFRATAPTLKAVDMSRVRDLFALGVKFFIIQIQCIVLYQTTNILIANTSSATDVTAYNIAYRYINVAMMVYTIILTPLWPAFTDAYTKRDLPWMRRIYKTMVKVYLISAAVMLLMIIAAPAVYHVWIGDRATIPAVMTIAVGIYMMLHTWDSLQVTLINGVGAIKLQTYVTLAGMLVHIPLALFLGHRLGAVGVIASMTIVILFYAATFTMQINKILSNKAIGVWIS